MFLDMLFKKMYMEGTFVEQIVSYSVVLNQYPNILDKWRN